ncbi:MAG: hypothetical protein J6P12_01990 [Methanobrevibacter sp.]|nr:hypothetical protein [Methanobrevibacter sp.]
MNFNSIISEDQCPKYFSYYKNIACFSVPLEKEGKECSYINGECIEIESECENYKGTKAEECEGIIPQNNPISAKCIFDSGECKEVSKTCSDYIYGQPQEFCEEIHNDGKVCRYKNGICFEIEYDYCEDYKGENKSFCENLSISLPYHKCEFDSTEGCITVPIYQKNCPISDFLNCSIIELEDDNKYCFPVSDECKEFYRDCSLINNEDECNSNIPADYERFKCTYKNGNCTQEPIDYCAPYLFNNSCTQIKLSNETKICQYLYEGCIETYKKCEFYEGTNQQECESIAPEDYLTIKCVFTEGKCKSVKRTSCTEDYTLRGLGYYKDICKSIQPNDEDKYCYFKDSFKDYMCFEHYKECSLYKGNDEKICNQIITQNNEACEMQNGKCVTKTQYQCSDYEHNLNLTFPYSLRFFCEYIPVSDIMKECTYKVSDNSCVESEKQCYDFEGSANREICEKAPTLIFWKKCVLESGTTKCTMEDKQCKEINLDSIKETCEKALASPYRERCNPFIGPDECVLAEKQCADVSAIMEESCAVAKTSSSQYKCVVSADKKSCIEKDINDTSDSNDENDKNDSNDTDHANFINSFWTILIGSILIL